MDLKEQIIKEYTKWRKRLACALIKTPHHCKVCKLKTQRTALPALLLMVAFSYYFTATNNKADKSTAAEGCDAYAAEERFYAGYQKFTI